jgi:glutamate 5-kinase
MALYDDLFGQFNQPVAQVLLTKNDLSDVSYEGIGKRSD